jgi:hypothetical protein
MRLRHDRTVCASIDTGFNGYLLWENVPPDLPDFGEVSPLYEEVEVAGGRILVMLGLASIHWFDEEGTYRQTDLFLHFPTRDWGQVIRWC